MKTQTHASIKNKHKSCHRQEKALKEMFQVQASVKLSSSFVNDKDENIQLKEEKRSALFKVRHHTSKVYSLSCKNHVIVLDFGKIICLKIGCDA